MNKKLKPCPFCGGKAKVMYREAEFIGWRGDGMKDKSFFVYVACNRCRARGPLVKSDVIVGKEQYMRGFERLMTPYRNDAIDAWNRRIGDA